MTDRESRPLKLYIKPGCPWCIAAVAHLEEAGYTFEKIDVLHLEDRFEEMKRISGQSLAPTLAYQDLVLADFGVPELEKFLEENDISPENSSGQD